MIKEVFVTADGSHSIFLPALGETYHSRHGAIQESNHVYIQQGFLRVAALQPRIRILELGLGTGLNALLTLLAAEQGNVSVDYWAVEPFPLSVEEANCLNFSAILENGPTLGHFRRLHAAEWDRAIEFPPHFLLHKLKLGIQELGISERFDLIYFDAFGPEKQPELWTEEIFYKMFNLLNPGGLLTTYCAKGDVRRALQTAGFRVERKPGPPGKREMLVAVRPMIEELDPTAAVAK